ncbi:hypothetical protein, partial [Salmonella enterica]|uniref:hypothetical protein n=1 Tax=Salmonella enterica TaxID=28901 RepID=UPI0020C4CA61
FQIGKLRLPMLLGRPCGQTVLANAVHAKSSHLSQMDIISAEADSHVHLCEKLFRIHGYTIILESMEMLKRTLTVLQRTRD